MKKWICILCLALSVCMVGCEKEEEPKDDVVEKVDIVENDVYETPIEPTDMQITLYNALTEALNEPNEETIATLVAQNFVADFYTFSNKKNNEDIGGLTYLPKDRRDEFKEYASMYAYANYEKIIQNQGKKNLPKVKEVKVGEVSSESVSYSDGKTIADYNGYSIPVTITFEKTKVASEELPSEAIVTVISLDGVYRVIALK